MQIQLNTQYEKSGLQGYKIDNVFKPNATVLPLKKMSSQDVDMMDQSKTPPGQKTFGKYSSAMSVSTGANTADTQRSLSSGDDGSGDRRVEGKSQFTNVMYERW